MRALKGEGRYKGRAPTARAKPANIVRLASGGAKCEDIAKRLGVGVASVYRVLYQDSLIRTHGPNCEGRWT